MVPSTSMWFPFLNWLVLMMADQPFLEPKFHCAKSVKIAAQLPSAAPSSVMQMAIPRHGLGSREVIHTARYAALPTIARSGPLAAWLLPRPAWGWRLQVRLVQDTLLTEHAARYGMSVDEYRSAALRRIRGWLNVADVRVRMDAALVERFVHDGRYRSQFEVGMSGGLLHPALRIILEQSVLGIPAGARKRDRPVYGYIGGTNEDGRVQQYGDVVVIPCAPACGGVPPSRSAILWMRLWRRPGSPCLRLPRLCARRPLRSIRGSTCWPRRRHRMPLTRLTGT
jgi:hypothetical protein